MKITNAYTTLEPRFEKSNRDVNNSPFAQKITELKNADTLEISSQNRVNRAEMSMDEYKAYIHDAFSSMKLHSSREDDWISVNITEEGFEAMKNDPEYEKWVLDTVRSDLMSSNPYAKYGSIIDIKYFGASKAEYRCESYNSGLNKAAEKEQEEKNKLSFWERRRKRQKMYFELSEKHRLEQEEITEEAIADKLMKEENIYSKKGKKFTFSAAQDIFSHMDMFM